MTATTFHFVSERFFSLDQQSTNHREHQNPSVLDFVASLALQPDEGKERAAGAVN